ncbi:MAG: tetratricopeptide repeat protein, partial [Sulfitobacter sp.]|nr:tetratricopeptide repeat protein [Sulfitobacter sp.]
MISFQALGGIDDLWITQWKDGKDSEVEYFISRREGDRIGFRSIGIDDALLQSAKARGIKLKGSTSNGFSVQTRKDLLGMVELYAKVYATELSNMEHFDALLHIANSQETAGELLLDVLTANCLARAGHPLDMAMQKLTPEYSNGVEFGKIDPKIAGKSCEAATQLESPTASARFAMARILTVQQRYGASMPIIKELMEESFGPAFIAEADLYERGLGRTKDPEKAVEIIRRAAEAGFPAAQYQLAILTQLDRIEGSDADALALYLSAFKGGLIPAAARAGTLLQNGKGIRHDPVRAYALFSEGAKAGDFFAMSQQAYALSTGIGVTKNQKSALEINRVLAKRGYAWGQYSAGYMLARGQGA